MVIVIRTVFGLGLVLRFKVRFIGRVSVRDSCMVRIRVRVKISIR